MGVGGLLVAVGVLVMWLMADEGEPAPAVPPSAEPTTPTT
jgi:hypothetical protein